MDKLIFYLYENSLLLRLGGGESWAGWHGGREDRVSYLALSICQLHLSLLSLAPTQGLGKL